MIPLFAPGLSFYVEKMVEGKPFTFIRYGDADWRTIVKHHPICLLCGLPHRLDLPGLREGMIRSIKNRPDADNYYLATRSGIEKPGTVEYFGFLQWLTAHGLRRLTWHDCNVFAYAAMEGGLYPFIEAIRNLNVPRIVIGPEWMRCLDEKFPIERFVSVPEVDCWQDRKRIMAECLDVEPPCWYSLSAGVAAKAFAWQLYMNRGFNSWILDLGSLWDVFVGVPSRSYHKSMTASILSANLGGKSHG